MGALERVRNFVWSLAPDPSRPPPLLRGRLIITGTAMGMPGCVLRASTEALELDVQLYGRIVLAPYEVIELEPTLTSRLLLPGILIHHTRSDLPEYLHFCTLLPPTYMLKRVRASGFREMAPYAEPAGYRVTKGDAPDAIWSTKPAIILLLVIFVIILALTR